MRRNSFYLLTLIFALSVISCKDEDEKISAEQTSAVNDQSVAEAQFNDANDMSTAAFSAPSAADISGRTTNGKSITITVAGDTRFTGATVTLETVANNNPLNPQGTITIDFGAGKTDSNGNTRKGKIIVTYKGLRFVPTSTMELTFAEYFVNGIKVEGKRTVTTTSLDNTGISFGVKDVGGKVTFADGTFVTRDAVLTYKWQFGATAAANQWIIEGTANGKTRDAKTYTFVINKALVFKVECALAKNYAPAQGEVLLTVGIIPIKIDYGTGTCDNLVTVSVNGITQEITVTN
ncbi:MAG: hypothetical protein ACOYW3_00295 [Bacteroidota bacterium]